VVDSTRDKYDIVIVGLGPVGAVAANLAGAAGFRTLVVERSSQPYRQPRAIVFDAEIMRIFDSIGLAEPITAATRPLGGSIYLGADHRPIRTFHARPPAHAKAWFPSNLFFQPQLEAIIRDGVARHPNVTVLLAHEVVDLDQAGSGVTLRLASQDGVAPKDVDATYVLACDGASSTVRKTLGIPLDDIGFEERWLVVDTFVDGPMRWPRGYEIPQEVRDNRYSLMVCDPARPSTLIPGVGRHRRWEYMLMPGEHPDDVVPDAWLRRQLALWVDPTQVEIVRSAVYRFRALVARRWRSSRVFLVGDAAHQTPPFYGQGMCHGLRDAAQLIWRLRLVRDGLAADSLLDSYQAEREPHVREIITASVAAGAAVCKTDPAQAAARDAAFRTIERERAQRPVAMTDIVPPIRAGVIDPATGGDRLPEFTITGPDGATQRLDALIDGRFLVLGLEEIAPPSPLDLAVIAVTPADMIGGWLRAQRARFAIIRPDRYVHSVAADARELADRLALLHAQLGLAATDITRASEMTLP
jgi:3-(3-hydroxy-phenyl)propionate hydroxylase